MAVGSTSDHRVRRNKIVEQALRAVRAVKPGVQPDNNLMRDGIIALNEILREDDQDMTGEKRSLWALAESHILLAVGQYRYTTTEGLGNNIQDVQLMHFRDTGGADNPMSLITPNQYEALSPKNEVGDPEKAVLEINHLDLTSQVLKVWPVPASIGTTSEVLGTDALNYQCILKHTADAINKPITGASYRLFWKQAGVSGAAWVDESEYTNGALIRLAYKRPLFDFDLPDSDPDLPSGWGNYLKWRLAVELSPMFKVNLEERTWMQGQVMLAVSKLFPNTRAKSQDTHHKAKFF